MGAQDFFVSNSTMHRQKAAHIPLNINMSNGMLIHSPHTSDLVLTTLPPQEKTHILPALVHNSFVSVGQLCDSGCDITVTKEQVTVSKDGKCVMLGSQDPHSRLWRVNRKKRVKPVQKLEWNHAHEISNQKKWINYMHAACFSPKKIMWITAIKNGKFTSWPGWTDHAVKKCVSKSAATVKCHMNQQRMDSRSTKIKEEE
jgi:hypothetical protein